MDENIVGYGVAKSHRDQFLIAGGILVLVLTLVTWLGWALLHQTFSIPENTSILFAVSPHTATRLLSGDEKLRLSKIWQAALDGTSGMSVILGAAKTDTGWQTFALIPRWHSIQNTDGLTITSHGLVTMITDGSPSVSPSMRGSVAFTDQWSWWSEHLSADAIVRADMATLFGLSSDQSSGFETLAVKNGVITMDIPFQSGGSNLPLTDADVSLNLPNRGTEALAPLLSALRIGELNLSTLAPRLAQINVNLDMHGKAAEAMLLFRDDMTDSEARELLAGFGIGERHSTKLPDDTVVYETWLPKNGSNVSGAPSSYGHVSLHGRELRLGDSKSSSFSSIDAHCPDLTPWMHLSTQLVDNLMQHVGVSVSSTVSDVIFGAMKGKLTVCFK